MKSTWMRLCGYMLVAVSAFMVATPVLADNCGSATDCFNTIDASTAALIGLGILLGAALLIGGGYFLLAAAGEEIAAAAGEGLAEGIAEAMGEGAAEAAGEGAAEAAGEGAAETAGEAAGEGAGETAGEGAGDSAGEGAGETPETQYGPKIEQQMEERGWTKEDVENTIDHPDRTVETQDTRWNPDGTRNNDPATAYINEDGSYVVRNDRTGDIVQISDRTDPGWKSPFD